LGHPRRFVRRRRARALVTLTEVKLPRVWAEIDLGAFAHNLGRIRQRAGAGVETILVLKADAYGHGALPLAAAATRLGIHSFGVGTLEEGLELRRAGLGRRLLVLGTIVDEEAEEALREGIELGVHSTDRCRMLNELACRLGTRARVHLNVDTGMGRLGVLPERAPDLLQRIHRSPGLELCGTMTHIAATEGGREPFGRDQVRRFDDFLASARAAKLPTGLIHLANSAALFTDLGGRRDAIRPGIAAFGMLPPGLSGEVDLQPILSLRSQVIFFKDIAPGTPIGYGGTWRAERPSRIATLPIGYDDGVPWRLSNRGRVLVHGAFAPIIGRVSMDYLTIDVTEIPGVEVGDVVTLIGSDQGRELTAQDLAEQAGTIPYEVTCSIGKRVKRVLTGVENLERMLASHGETAAALPVRADHAAVELQAVSRSADAAYPEPDCLLTPALRLQEPLPRRPAVTPPQRHPS
jgi:alanine racemase